MSTGISRQDMPTQNPEKRILNFDEVALGYDVEQALLESQRCLNCKNSPCISGCPVGINIRDFIKSVKNKDYLKAYRIIKDSNNLPGICGRVCPQEIQCEKSCVLYKQGNPVAIGRLERFVADWALVNNIDEKIELKNKKLKVAVIGSGPAGLTCAADLAKNGFEVTIFESLHSAGGVLRYGIPEFRLPKDIVNKEIEFIKKLGVIINLNVAVGKTVLIDDLKKEGFKAFFVATGAGLPHFLNIPGESLNGVYSANEFLTRINLMNAYMFPKYETPISIGRTVCVIGGGNVAIDCARVAARLCVDKVTLLYRRSYEEMPARREEIENAKQEGIEFIFLSSPVEIIGDDGNVSQIKCVRNTLEALDSTGRKRPVQVAGSEFLIPSQTVICAIGQGANPLLLSSMPELNLNKKGNIEVDENMMSSVKGLFAGGDIVTGAATVIEAMGAGKKAAQSINEYLEKSDIHL